jgi:glycogenin glucosyltransferase
MKSVHIFLIEAVCLASCVGIHHGKAENYSRSREAYVTLLTTEEYVQGAIVLARIVRSFSELGNNSRPFLALVYDKLLRDPGGVALRQLLEYDGIDVIPVPSIGEPMGHQILNYPQYRTTYMKLHVWNLTGYDTVLYLDADILPLEPLSPLFERSSIAVDTIAAAPDISLPDSFNAGVSHPQSSTAPSLLAEPRATPPPQVMLLKPSAPTYAALLALSRSIDSYDGGDQGLLNRHFAGWYSSDADHRLPFAYK